MRIRSRVKIGGALTFCILLAYGSAVLHLNRAMTRLAREVKESNEIVNKINILRSLTQDYLLYRTERAQRQWSEVYAELLRLLRNSDYRVLRGEYGLGDASQKLRGVGDTYSRLLTIRGNPGPAGPGTGTGEELQRRLTTQLLLATQDLTTRFFSLTEEINQKLINTQHLSSFLDMLSLSILAVLLAATMIFLQRSVVKPVLQLHEGAEIIGAGNLDHRVEIASRDEIGELSRAFDRITANLQQVTVSRDDLAREIEVRKHAEVEIKRLASFPQMNPTPILEIDLDGVITFYNQAAVAAVDKLGPASDLGGLIPEDLGEIIAAVREKHQTFFYREMMIGDRVFGQNIYFIEPFQVIRIYCFDITERQKAEENLKLTLLDLERSNRDLEDFAYISSHDLQEPLRKIANFSEMLTKQYQGQLDEQAVRYFGYVTDGAKRLQDLINDLLNYSRVGRAEIPLIPASLEDILKGTLNDLHTLIKDSHAEISREPLPALKVNPHQMGQLLQNLLTNAIKFHGDQPPRIHLAARQEDREWVISVRDYGIGFEPQYADDIFKIFKRLHSKEEYPGTGIGLAICKKIVERHGGRIWAEAEPGRGATFFFTIPA
ncbi:MAG: sensor histidine kinase [Desulfobaccales bacterium]